MKMPALTIEEQHHIDVRCLVLAPVGAVAQRHPGARSDQAVYRCRAAGHAGRPRRAMVRRGARRGARLQRLAVGQAGGAHLRGTRHLVRRHRAVRRPAAHARRQRAWRDHAAGGAQGRLQGAAGDARRAVRGAAAAELPAPAADVQPDRGPEHAARWRARLAKQILLLVKSYGVAQGDEIRIGTAARAGRPGAVARRVAPARQPGAQGFRARRARCASSRRGWWCCRASCCCRLPNADKAARWNPWRNSPARRPSPRAMRST